MNIITNFFKIIFHLLTHYESTWKIDRTSYCLIRIDKQKEIRFLATKLKPTSKLYMRLLIIEVICKFENSKTSTYLYIFLRLPVISSLHY